MDLVRLHWFDIGPLLAALALGIAILGTSTAVDFLLWVSLASLFLHQFEEYRLPGTFPGMVNTVMFASPHPDRYPLNTSTALIINVGIGWSTYLLAALLGRQAIWLGIATVLVSLGNVVAHGVLFNVKGRTRYNPGMLTAVVLFIPIAMAFASVVIGEGLASGPDWIIGILLGLALNYLGVVKLIDRLKDPDTRFVFPPRSLLPAR